MRSKLLIAVTKNIKRLEFRHEFRRTWVSTNLKASLCERLLIFFWFLNGYGEGMHRAFVWLHQKALGIRKQKVNFQHWGASYFESGKLQRTNKFLRFLDKAWQKSWTRSMWAWKDHFRCQKWKNNFIQCRTQAFCGPLSAKSGHDYESVCRKLFENSTVLEQGWGGLSCGSQMSTQEKVKKSEI